MIKKVLARVAKATDGIDASDTTDIGVGEVWSAVASHLGGRTSELTPIRDGVVWNLRLPRTLLAAVYAAGLAVCGAVVQSLLRNPPAAPFVLGVSVTRTRLMLQCVTALDPPPVRSAWTTRPGR